MAFSTDSIYYKKPKPPLTPGQQAAATESAGVDPSALSGSAQLQRVLDLLRQAKLESALGTQKAIGQYKKSLPVIQKAYKGASANINLMANDATRRALEGGQQANAGVTQGLAGRGLYNTSLLGSGRRSVYGQVAGQLATINAGRGGFLGQLAQDQGQATQAAYGQIAGALQGGSAAQSNLTGQQASTISGVQYQPKSSLWDLVGAAAPYFAAFGGFGGGAKPQTGGAGGFGGNPWFGGGI